MSSPVICQGKHGGREAEEGGLFLVKKKNCSRSYLHLIWFNFQLFWIYLFWAYGCLACMDVYMCSLYMLGAHKSQRGH